MIEIIKTEPGDSNFYLFQNFPREIYDDKAIGFKLYETIDTKFLQSCFIITDGNKVCARASLYNNPRLLYLNKKTFTIGNYESINDDKISSKLFSKLILEAKKDDAEFIIGPMNGSTWNIYRFSVHHNEPHFFNEPYHYLYYNDQFINAGFKIIAKYFSSIDTHLEHDDPNVIKRENELRDEGVSFRNINLTKYDEELEKLYAFNSLSFKTNFLYTPLDKEDFIQKYSETRKIINDDFVIIAEDKNENLIGYFFCIDNLYNTSEKSLIIKTIARHPDEKWKGLGHVIGNMIYRKAAERNYKSIIHAFMYQQGTSTTISKNFSGDIFKNYVLYGKEI